MPSSSSPQLLLCVTVLILAAVSSLGRGQECSTTQACMPWYSSGPSCARGGRMNLRFVLDTAAENAWTSGTTKTATAVYGFCPVVDTVQSFALNSAPFIATSFKTEDADEKITYHLTTSLDKNYLSVYGFGSSNSTLHPIKGVSDGSVLVAQNGSTLCSGKNSVAIATHLNLEVGLHKGLFNYATTGPLVDVAVNVTNPNFNETLCNNPSSDSAASSINYCDTTIVEIRKQQMSNPLKTGFVPTCGVDNNGNFNCLFDSSPEVICIGDRAEMMNCAKCYDDATVIGQTAKLVVWNSYYGTDNRGNTLKSGGNNPINFAKFSGPNMMSDIASKMKSLWDGNLSDVGLPNWVD